MHLDVRSSRSSSAGGRPDLDPRVPVGMDGRLSGGAASTRRAGNGGSGHRAAAPRSGVLAYGSCRDDHIDGIVYGGTGLRRSGPNLVRAAPRAIVQPVNPHKGVVHPPSLQIDVPGVAAQSRPVRNRRLRGAVPTPPSRQRAATVRCA